MNFLILNCNSQSKIFYTSRLFIICIINNLFSVQLHHADPVKQYCSCVEKSPGNWCCIPYITQKRLLVALQLFCTYNIAIINKTIKKAKYCVDHLSIQLSSLSLLMFQNCDNFFVFHEKIATSFQRHLRKQVFVNGIQ